MGRSLTHQERLAFGDGMYVSVIREATLSEDLSSIDERLVRHFFVSVNYQETQFTLRRNAALQLRDALTKALDRTAGMEET